LGLAAVWVAVLFAAGCRVPPEDHVTREGSGAQVTLPVIEPAPLDSAALVPLVVLPRVGGEFGSPVPQLCESGSVVVGIHGGAGGLLDSIAPICAELSADSTFDDDVAMERVGGGGGEPYRERCEPGSVVVGIRGGAGDLVDRVAIGCLPAAVALDPSSTAEPVYSEGVGGDGGRAYEARCPPGSVVGGLTVAAGRVLDSLTVECVAPAGSAANSSAFVFTMADPSPDELIGRLNVVTSHESVLFIDGVESTVESRNHAVELTEGTYELDVVFAGGVMSDVRTVNIRPYALTRVFFRRPEVAGP
jgi:hypothetical protein